ncbi:hypothetical protein BC829DRAFT_447263 [Chytridium lagenaria]|nr:hypothetical protein BC829DRAFT_447263 [Chytridium lagenaria]
MTPLQKATVQTRYAVDVDGMLRPFLAHLKKYNPKYSAVDDGAFTEFGSNDGIIIDRTDDNENGEEPLSTAAISHLHASASVYNNTGSIVPLSSMTAEQSVLDAGRYTLLLRMDEGPHQSAETETFLVRRSNQHPSSSMESLVTEMFVSLFPFGRGGPNEKRLNHMGFHSWVKYCLQLDGIDGSGGLFERHYGFLMVAFDYIAMKKANSKLYYSLKISKEALLAGEVTSQSVQRYLVHARNVAVAQLQGRRPPSATAEIKKLMGLRKGIATGEQAFWGSNASRSWARHICFGYTYRFGVFQLFVTLSPDTAGIYSVSVMAGEVDKKTIKDCDKMLLPTRSDLKAIAARNPATSARYYDTVMNTFISDILGWDRTHCRPRAKSGLFGIVKAFVVSTETQKGGDLHGHVLIWLHGFPTTTLKMHEKLTGDLASDVEFRSRLMAYATAIARNDVPILPSASTCPKTECNGIVSPVDVIPGEAYKLPLKEAVPVPTSACSDCKTKFAHNDIVDAHLKPSLSYKVDCREIELTKMDIDYIRFSPPKLSESSTETLSREVEVTLIVKGVNLHFWTHVGSCFKFAPSRLGSFFISDTSRLGSFYITVTSRLGSFFITVTPDSGVSLMESPPDSGASFIESPPDSGVSLKESPPDSGASLLESPPDSGSQNKVHNNTALCAAAFDKAFKRLLVRTDYETLSTRERGSAILRSLMYSLTNSQEVAATLCALYIQVGDIFYWSHDHVGLSMGPILNRMHDQEKEVDVIISTSFIETLADRPVNDKHAIVDYWYRPQELENQNFITLVENYHLVPGIGRIGQSLLTGHPLSGRFHLVANKTRAVMVLTGQHDKLPDITDTTKGDHKRELHYELVCILFHPHRKGTMMPSSWEDFYRSWILENGSSKAVSDAIGFAEIHADYHTSARHDRSISAATQRTEEDICIEEHPCEMEHDTQIRQMVYHSDMPQDAGSNDGEDGYIHMGQETLDVAQAYIRRMEYVNRVLGDIPNIDKSLTISGTRLGAGVVCTVSVPKKLLVPTRLYEDDLIIKSEDTNDNLGTTYYR